MLTANQNRRHDDLIKKIESVERKFNEIESKSYVPYINFRWAIGLLVATLFTLYGYNIKMLYTMQDMVIELKTQQKIVIYRIETLQESLYDMKWSINGPTSNRKNPKR